MDNKRFPNKVWLYIDDKGVEHSTANKDSLPDGCIACEYSINNDPFRARIKREVIEEPV